MKNLFYTTILLFVYTYALQAQETLWRKSITFKMHPSFNQNLNLNQTVQTTGIDRSIRSKPILLFGIDINFRFTKNIQAYASLNGGGFAISDQTIVTAPQIWSVPSNMKLQSGGGAAVGFALIGAGIKVDWWHFKKSRLTASLGSYNCFIIGKSPEISTLALPIQTGTSLFPDIEMGGQKIESVTKRAVEVGHIGLGWSADFSERWSLDLGLAYFLSGKFIRGEWTRNAPGFDTVVTSGSYTAGLRNAALSIGLTRNLRP